MRRFLHCLILPHPANNHRARLLSPKFLILSIFIFIFSALAITPRSLADISSNELFTFTNQKRVENGLPPLALNQALSLAASRKADDMFAKNYWAHNSPDGLTPWFFIKNAGYSYVYAGENLARGFHNANDVVNAWMGSPSHRANILSTNYKEVGFAVKSGVLSGESTFLVVQEFGSRSVVPVKRTPVKKPKIGSSNRVLGISFPSFSFTISSEIAITVMLLFIGLLILDAYLINRKKIARVVGHNMDHAVFLSVIILIILLFRTPMIL